MPKRAGDRSPTRFWVDLGDRAVADRSHLRADHHSSGASRDTSPRIHLRDPCWQRRGEVTAVQPLPMEEMDMPSPSTIPIRMPTTVRPSRWRVFILSAALTLAFGGGSLAQEATPAEECIPIEDEDGCLATAPADARVDLEEPVFSNPAAITNPLLPISDQVRLIQFGVDEGETIQIESSLMPETKRIVWNGQEIDAVVSQVVAYADGRILEVTYDFFAQDDEGNVWYLGEDVLNYEDGEVADTNGTWLAGEDGPPGMILPANPAKGDVFRPENIPGLVFEEVTITATGVTVQGPRGPVAGAIETSELLADGGRETKYFAPGYGEFSALSGTEYVTVALGLPIDADWR